jgi:hypothetical protein
MMHAALASPAYLVRILVWPATLFVSRVDG